MGLDWEGNRLQVDGQRWMDRECPETAWNWKIRRWCQPGTGETPVFYRWGEKNTASEAENGKPESVKKTRASVMEAKGRGHWGRAVITASDTVELDGGEMSQVCCGHILLGITRVLKEEGTRGLSSTSGVAALGWGSWAVRPLPARPLSNTHVRNACQDRLFFRPLLLHRRFEGEDSLNTYCYN